MKRCTRAVPGVLALLLAAGCGGDSKPAEVKKAEEPVVEAKTEPVKNKHTLEREAKAKALEDAKAYKIEMVEKLTVLPATLPKKLDKACEGVGVAMDLFMLKWFPDNWPKTKTKQLADLKESCLKNNIETAACQAKALTDAPEELNKAVPELLGGCIEKFAKKPAG